MVVAKRSEQLFEEAQKLLPGGVSSPVRALKAVGGTPLFIARALGSKLHTVDSQELIDYVGSWGPLILGHAHPEVVRAVQEAARRGTSYGAPTELELELARLVRQAFPSIELVRFVSSGTEATMSTLRLSRAYTQRDKIVKFAGCYHGHADFLLVEAGSGVMTLGLPGSAGVPQDITKHTLVATFNDLDAVRALFKGFPEEIAAVIVEPIAGNMGVVPPRQGFLEGLRELTQEHGALLIFDEVITGFRVAFGGAQQLYGVEPDLTCLGKILGGGLPVGAYGGRRELMELIAPLGPVYQAGTLSGNPLAMAAGIATLKQLKEAGVYERLDSLAARLAQGLLEAAQEAGVPLQVNRVGSMLTPFFAESPVEDYASAQKADTECYARFFWGLVERGVYGPPSQFEAWFVSLAHTSEDIEHTVEAAQEALKELAS
jgi:glutamate-1-semialdehyde 2,1-aminomutase